ncbi:gamma-type small acid-soluble spore protein [Sporosarcina sp. ACRSL]|uniref:gamma-type small acid-soluble spore protein n=1 Tax=Sporosarcina sp. ACRSL TaxID=2918215 RepID=UPI001EF50173|nr:gamma-type small acid-soluble spore protein [Sporosarcina sp. ACRSL]MCG7343364.1 gamma-type small acid-soluble spore protein [Sporosarcina sp. ACRSL]
MKEPKKFTEAGTDIEEVKRQNANSGLSYNEVKNLLAQTGGKGTAKYSDTDPMEIRKANEPK